MHICHINIWNLYIEIEGCRKGRGFVEHPHMSYNIWKLYIENERARKGRGFVGHAHMSY